MREYIVAAMIRKQIAAVMCPVSRVTPHNVRGPIRRFGNGDQDGAERPDGAGLRRREDPAIDPAENETHEQHDRDQLDA